MKFSLSIFLLSPSSGSRLSSVMSRALDLDSDFKLQVGHRIKSPPSASVTLDMVLGTSTPLFLCRGLTPFVGVVIGFVISYHVICAFCRYDQS
jgi:hypothetical protein